MPFDDILCSWLVRSALVSLTILLIGSGAVLIWRQPLRRVRIIELVLAGCLIAPWLGMIPGYPQFSLVASQPPVTQKLEVPLPAPVESMTEPAIPEPDDAFSLSGSCRTGSSRNENRGSTRPCFRDSPLDRRHLPCWRGYRDWLVACGDRRFGTPLVVVAARTITLPGIAGRDFRWAK